MKRKMIITDLDGTLLRRDKTVSKYTQRIICECNNRNFVMVMATGRPERTVLPYMNILNPSVVVSNNGAKINFCDSAVVDRFEIDTNIVRKIIPKLVEQRSFVCLDYDEYSLTNCPEYREWKNWNAFYTPDFLKYDATGVQKISIRNPNLILNTFDYNVCVSQSDGWHMITSTNASKAKAVERIALHYGVSVEDIVAFGDDQNDMEMLQMCGIGVAMENAITELKLQANCICLSNESDGVANWIEKNLISP